MKFSLKQVARTLMNDRDFEMEDLSSLDLSDFDFRGSNLKMTILRNSDLRGAKLSNLKISGDCSGADFRGAILTNTKFSGAYLKDAQFDQNPLPAFSEMQLSHIKK